MKRSEFRRRGAGRCSAAALLALVGLSACARTETEGSTPPEARVPPMATQERRPPPGKAWVIFGVDTVTAEVARTADERAEGLMYRDEVSAGTGMLFVFEDVAIRSFWMQNTYVPLDIAFLDATFTVVDIQQMEPLTTDPHESRAPAMFALEVPQGWFADQEIEPGAKPSVVFGS
jgi:uncharacterized membrane protein (UPF0127 family)